MERLKKIGAAIFTVLVLAVLFCRDIIEEVVFQKIFGVNSFSLKGWFVKELNLGSEIPEAPMLVRKIAIGVLIILVIVLTIVKIKIKGQSKKGE